MFPDRAIVDAARDLEVVPHRGLKRNPGQEQLNKLGAVVLIQQGLSKKQDRLEQEP